MKVKKFDNKIEINWTEPNWTSVNLALIDLQTEFLVLSLLQIDLQISKATGFFQSMTEATVFLFLFFVYFEGHSVWSSLLIPKNWHDELKKAQFYSNFVCELGKLTPIYWRKRRNCRYF